MRKIEGGYGIVSRSVLTSPEIPVECKAIYALLSAYAGDEVECYPTIETMRKALGITVERLYKYLNILISTGIVKRVGRKGGVRGPVIYKICDAENQHCGNSVLQDSGITENPYYRKSTLRDSSITENGDSRITENQQTNNNNINNNNINTSEQTPKNGTGIFIILEDGTFYDVLPDKLTMWQQAYPELDVERELYRMASWCDANPTKRKTRRGIEKFINGWLNRSQKDGQQNSKKEEVRNDAGEAEEKQQYRVSSGNEIYERLKREGVV